MSIEIKVPVLPESVSDATIAKWYKQPGEAVKRDEHLVDVETDKVVLEVVAPKDGTLENILKPEGATVKAEEVIASFIEGGGKSASPEVSKEEPKGESKAEPKEEPKSESKEEPKEEPKKIFKAEFLSPSARRLSKEEEVDVSTIKGTGKKGRVTKEDIQTTQQSQQPEKKSAAGESKSKTAPMTKAPMFTDVDEKMGERLEKRVPMTRLRARIAERLIEAQQTAAILTTFNEINMQPVIEIRKKYKDIFEKTYGVRLGFMSFFTFAVVEALKHFPIINASVDGNDIVYHGYYDIGIAVSSPRGLVVPVLRNAERMTMDEIEKQISQLAKKAETGQLSIEEITGGTFTITNGGVFGSLMATPILNPPQSGILGMHKIEERPIALNGEIVIRPMMYVALSYDHRIIDGAESVRFLVTVKELLEDPARLALGI